MQHLPRKPSAKVASLAGHPVLRERPAESALAKGSAGERQFVKRVGPPVQLAGGVIKINYSPGRWYPGMIPEISN